MPLTTEQYYLGARNEEHATLGGMREQFSFLVWSKKINTGKGSFPKILKRWTPLPNKVLVMEMPEV